MINLFNIFNTIIHFVDTIDRFPVLFILDSISCCYLVRALKIKNPMYSLVLSLIMATTADSLESYFSNGTVAVLTDPYLSPLHLIIWLLFNFSPYDIIYKTARHISPIMSVIIGFNEGRETVIAVEIAKKMDSFWVYTIIFSVLFSSANFIALAFTARCMLQRLRSPGPIFFEIAVCSCFYYFFTANFEFDIKIHIDSKHTFNLKHFLHSFSVETVKFMAILITVVLRVIQNWVKEETYTKLWKDFEYLFGSFVPYYGKTWILPKQEVKHVHRPSLSILSSSGDLSKGE